MKVTLKLDALGNGICTVEREPGDPRMHRGGWGTAESQLLRHVQRALQQQGYDVIKKRMWKDGHLVDEYQQYVRERNPVGQRQLSVWHGEYAIEDAGAKFNREGKVDLIVTNLV